MYTEQLAFHMAFRSTCERAFRTRAINRREKNDTVSIPSFKIKNIRECRKARISQSPTAGFQCGGRSIIRTIVDLSGKEPSRPTLFNIIDTANIP